jgi:hypothetical protein
MKELKEIIIASVKNFINWITRREEPLYYYIRFRVAMVCIFSLALYSGKTFYTIKKQEETIKTHIKKEDELKKIIADCENKKYNRSRLKNLVEGGIEIHLREICEICRDKDTKFMGEVAEQIKKHTKNK